MNQIDRRRRIGFQRKAIRKRRNRPEDGVNAGISLRLMQFAAVTKKSDVFFAFQDAMMKLFDRRVDPNLLVRRITVVAAHVLNEKDIPAAPEEQPDLFADYEALKKKKAAEQAELDKEKRLQQAVLNIKKRMGANAILKGMNLEKGATGKVRNEQIGGHRK